MRGKKDPTVQAAIALHLALRAMVLSAEWRSVQINTDQSQKLAQGDGATSGPGAAGERHYSDVHRSQLEQ